MTLIFKLLGIFFLVWTILNPNYYLLVEYQIFFHFTIDLTVICLEFTKIFTNFTF